MASADLRDELNCSICLEVYTDPVTLRCGHNFCRACINRSLDKERNQGGYTCPQCRTTFRKRPWFQKNVTLANIAERFHSASPHQGTGDVLCTYCIHAPVAAVKSCLHCEASLCDSHLKVHSKSSEHVLMEPTTSLENRKCPVHKKILEYYCSKDSTSLCASCAQEAKHRGHPVLKLEAAAKNKQGEMKQVQAQLILMRQETQKRIEELQEKRKSSQNAADAVIQQVGALFQKIVEKLDNLHAQTIDSITRQAEKNSQPLSDLIQRLSLKNDELASKIDHIEELCDATDPLCVLQESESGNSDFCAPQKGGREADPRIERLDEVLISLSLRKGLADILKSVPEALGVPQISEMRLDKRAASGDVAISADLSVALGTEENFLIEDSRYRFHSHQVLSRTGFFKGRHYWEVELGDTNSWRIGMSYPSIDRDGHNSIFGNTVESWCLCRSKQGSCFRHDGDQKIVSSSPSKKFKRLGIFLDYEKGRLSFYDVGLEVSHLHTYNESFTEPLHIAFRVGYGVWAKIVN
ncbi:E3 ubiquitin/ISG15 ligase TRIM25-like [Gastrophryne carolinensis]